MTTTRLFTAIASMILIMTSATTVGARDLDKNIPALDASAIVTPPAFPGGEESMMSSIIDNLTTFHLSAGEASADVMVSCTVSREGKVEGVRVEGEASPRMTARVKKAVERLPRFEPASVSGRAVDYNINFPLLISSSEE